MTNNNNFKKSKKHLIKDKRVKKSRANRAKRSKRNNIKSNNSSLSNLYTYESPTNNTHALDKSNSNLNVNVVNGLKDYLAIKK